MSSFMPTSWITSCWPLYKSIVVAGVFLRGDPRNGTCRSNTFGGHCGIQCNIMGFKLQCSSVNVGPDTNIKLMFTHGFVDITYDTLMPICQLMQQIIQKLTVKYYWCQNAPITSDQRFTICSRCFCDRVHRSSTGARCSSIITLASWHPAATRRMRRVRGSRRRSSRSCWWRCSR